MTSFDSTIGSRTSGGATQARGSGAGSLSRLLAASVGQVLLWQQRASERHQLRGVSDQMLKDIGLSRADIEGEAAKPFWRA